jgi:hypothetical protein
VPITRSVFLIAWSVKRIPWFHRTDVRAREQKTDYRLMRNIRGRP